MATTKTKSNFKYYNDNGITIVNYVWFKLLGNKGEIKRDYPNSACFAPILHNAIDNDAGGVQVYHERTAVPYPIPAIERWINDINELGFPCSFQTPCQDCNPDKYSFNVKFSDYEYKAHLASTLMLIRALYERGICRVPEIYFNMLDENPKADKFEVLQNAHKELTNHFDSHDYYAYPNTNHMITNAGNGKNITKKALFDRYKACGIKVLGQHKSNQDKAENYRWGSVLRITDKWKGE